MEADESADNLTESERESFKDITAADLEALYCPGYYRKGEELCVQILEKFDPDSEVALLFLVLNLAAQDQLDSALELVSGLNDQSLMEALRQLAFGQGADAESALYETIIEILEERESSGLVDDYFKTRDKPRPKAADIKGDKTWQKKLKSPPTVDEPFIDELNW